MLVLLFPHSVYDGWVDRVCCSFFWAWNHVYALLGVKVFIFDKSNYEGSNYLQGGGPRKATLGCKSFHFGRLSWSHNSWILKSFFSFPTSHIRKVQATWKVTYLGAKVFSFCKGGPKSHNSRVLKSFHSWQVKPWWKFVLFYFIFKFKTKTIWNSTQVEADFNHPIAIIYYYF
jgi:hypothetical protein